MKPILTHLLVLAFGIAVAVFLRPDSEEYHQPSGQTQKHARADRGTGDPASRHDTRPNRERYMEEISRQVSASDFDQWLLSMADDPHALAEAKATVGLLTRNPDLIREALAMDPDNPQLLYIGSTLSSYSDAERLGLAERFFKQDPENGLAAYLYAERLLATGDQKAGLDILRNATERQGMDDFSNPMGLLYEDAFLAAGYSRAAAKVKALTDLSMGYYTGISRMAKSLNGMASSLPAGEASEINSLAASIGRRIGEQMSPGTIMSGLVGLKLEAETLAGFPDDAPSPYQGLTVGEARQSIVDERSEILRFAQKAPDLGTILSGDPELASRYVDRVRLLGEVEAAKWWMSVNKAANE